MTQCPIASGDSFLYEFNVPDQAGTCTILLASLAQLTARLPGTFWYHSHLSLQYCDGLRGAFIVYDPEDPHAYMYDVDNGECGHLVIFF